MDIDMMTTREKTTLLAWLMGWRVQRYGASANPRYGRYGLYDANDKFIRRADVPNGIEINPLDHIVPNFYNVKNMALAWRVVTEINRQWENGEDWADGFFTWWNDAELWRLTATEAQAAWLDKILELAIEAGMI
jgi:hypothetical protein